MSSFDIKLNSWYPITNAPVTCTRLNQITQMSLVYNYLFTQPIQIPSISSIHDLMCLSPMINCYMTIGHCNVLYCIQQSILFTTCNFNQLTLSISFVTMNSNCTVQPISTTTLIEGSKRNNSNRSVIEIHSAKQDVLQTYLNK